MKINKNESETQFYLAYYMDNNEVDKYGNMNTQLKTAVIPIRLKNEFLNTFKGDLTPSKEEIFKFLRDNE